MIKDKEIKVSILSIMILLTFFSNLCSFIAITNRHKKKLCRMYYFLLHLAMADVLTAFLTLLPELIQTINPQVLDRHDVICRSIKFLQMFAPYLSSYILVAMTIDRYQSICYPILHRVWRPENSHRKIFISWLTALFCCIPQVFVFGIDNNSLTCDSQLGPLQGWKARIYVTWFALSNLFVPLCVLSFSYSKICLEIKQNTDFNRLNENNHFQTLRTSTWSLFVLRKDSLEKRLFANSFGSLDKGQHGSESSDSMRPRKHSKEGSTLRGKIRSVKQTVIIILGYIVCSSLAVGFQLWSVWVKPQSTLADSIEWFFWLVTWNSMLNPWLYIALDKELQSSLKKFFCCNRKEAKANIVNPLQEADQRPRAHTFDGFLQSKKNAKSDAQEEKRRQSLALGKKLESNLQDSKDGKTVFV